MSRLILALVAAMIATAGMAVPAIPFKKTFTQSDGTTITVGMTGDEWHGSAVTADNYMIAADSKGDYYYVTAAGMTGVKAHDASGRNAAERAFLSANEKSLRHTAQAMATKLSRQAPPRRASSTQVPTQGSPRIPILLVQYSDKQMSNSIATFNSQYKSGSKSAYQYFYDQSWGQYQPQYDVYGIYTLPNNRASYGAHGTNAYGSQVNDIGVAQMVIDGITQAGDEVDWSQYDNDGDGEVDVCIVVYAGVGEAQSYGYRPDAIWPCQWNLYSGQYFGDGTGPVTRNGKRINRFAVFNELNGWNDNSTQIDGVGTFCHEFSHCLGLPDFYDTEDSDGSYYGMGSWSIMCSGCYNDNGYTPCGYTAYEKEFMGWMQLTPAKENTKYTLSHIADNGAQAVKITSPYDSNEYYILENRQKTGWNAYIAASGLMVNHVTYSATDWNNNTVNNYETQRMTIIPADNRLSDYNEYGDLYPYNNNNSLTDTSEPAATLYTGSLMGQPVTEITKSGNNVSFWFKKGAYTKVIPVLELDEASVTNSQFTVFWNQVDNVDSYRLVVTDTESGNSFEVSNITTTTYTVSEGLEQGCTYNVRLYVKFTDGSEEFDAENDVTVTLGEEPELYPADEDDITTSSFVASWRPMKRVQSYILQVVEDGYNFYNKILEETFAKFTSSSSTNIANTLDTYMDNPGWRGSNVYSNEGGIKLGGSYASGYLVSPDLDAAQADNEVSMRMTLATTGKKTDDYPFEVSIGDSIQVIYLPAGSEGDYQLAMSCDTSNPIKVKFSITKGYPIIIKSLTIYAGNCTVETSQSTKAATMSGDAHRRVYTDVTDSFMNVEGLNAGTTYNFRLRALRLDGTYTMWTQTEQVTLKGSPAIPGDVDLSGTVDIDDVNIIIAIILGKDQAENYDRRAYVTDDDNIDVDDVNEIIRIILGKNVK